MSTASRNWTATHWEREGVPGAAVVDLDSRVIYRVTIGRGNGRVWVSTLDLDPEIGEVEPASLRRVPLAALALYVAKYLDARESEQRALREGTGKPDDSKLVLGMFGPEVRVHGTTYGEVPDSATVARLLKEGDTRQTLAVKYARSPSTVSDWIGRAYREVPEMMPPRRPGGRRPAPKPPDAE